MLIRIPHVLKADALERARRARASRLGRRPRQRRLPLGAVKDNSQLPDGSPVARKLGEAVLRALDGNRCSRRPRCRSRCCRRNSTATREIRTTAGTSTARFGRSPAPGTGFAPISRRRCFSRLPRTTTAASSSSRTRTGHAASSSRRATWSFIPAQPASRHAGHARHAARRVLLDAEPGARRRAPRDLVRLDIAILRITPDVPKHPSLVELTGLSQPARTWADA